MRISLLGGARRSALFIALACAAAAFSTEARAFTLTEPAGGTAVTVNNASKMRFSGACDKGEEEIRVSFVAKRIKGLGEATKHQSTKCKEIVIRREKGPKGKVVTARVWSTTMDLSRLPEGRVSILVSSGKRIKGVNLVKDVAPTLVTVASLSAPKKGSPPQVSAEGGCSKNGQTVVLSIPNHNSPDLSTICRNNSWSFQNIDLSEIDSDSIAVEVRHTNRLTGETDVTSFAVKMPQSNDQALSAIKGQKSSVASVQ